MPPNGCDRVPTRVGSNHTAAIPLLQEEEVSGPDTIALGWSPASVRAEGDFGVTNASTDRRIRRTGRSRRDPVSSFAGRRPVQRPRALAHRLWRLRLSV